MARTKQVDLGDIPVCTGPRLSSPRHRLQDCSKFRKKGKREAQFTLSKSATEPQVRVVEQYLQIGTQAKEAGNYAKALKKLEKGRDLLQQRGLESAEMCLQLGLVWNHFGTA